jgi:hypothetical protein
MANRAWCAAAAAAVLAGVLPRPARAADSGQGSAPQADDRTLVALAVALACAEAPEAGAGAPAPAAASPDGGRELELVATVRAKTLTFDAAPRAQVASRGIGSRRAPWKIERVNLPIHPQPGVVYHDVAVRLTLTGDAEELAALLREAKRASTGILLERGAPASAPPELPADAGAAPAPVAEATAPPAGARGEPTVPSTPAKAP